MIALLTLALFAAAFAASVWTLYISIKPQLHRYHALLAPAPVMSQLPLQAARVTVRWSAPARAATRTALRAAA